MLGFSPFKKHANKFNYTPRYYDPDLEAFRERRAEKGEQAPEEVALPEMVTPEVVAAIAMAIRLAAGEDHDRESEVLTIQTIKRAYSPWNSKIHGLTRLPERK